MDINLIKRLEHICLKSDKKLLTFGEEFQKTLNLPTMIYRSDNETENLDVDFDRINYNISRPFKEGTLQDWDDATPEDCNFGIILGIHKDHPHVFDDVWVDDMVANVCRQLAKTFYTSVYHHRTFTFGVGKSEIKNIIFRH